MINNYYNLPPRKYIEKFNQSAYYFFHALPYPHSYNCLNSMKRSEMTTMPSVLSAICCINWKNGFAPEKYYLDLFNAVQNGEIKMKYDEPTGN